MNASKENARHALENLLTQEKFMNAYAFKVLKEFIEAAERKLPSEAAFAAAKGSKRQPKK